MTINKIIVGLICPLSKQPLYEINGKLQTQDGKYCYSIHQGIARLLPASTMNYSVVIPARLNSTRLANKMLLQINGQPLISLVAQQALKSTASKVIVATDSSQIIDALTSLQQSQPRLQLMMTNSFHQSGTARIAQVVNELQWDPQHIVVNLQGDEPLIDPSVIEQVAKLLNDDTLSAMATLSVPLASQEFTNPNIVKVISNHQGYAQYFSRSIIPFARYQPEQLGIDFTWQKHIGIYAYRAEFLSNYSNLPASPWEQLESLEQLKALYYGYAIKIELALINPPSGVDTAEDFARVKKILES